MVPPRTTSDAGPRKAAWLVSRKTHSDIQSQGLKGTIWPSARHAAMVSV